MYFQVPSCNTDCQVQKSHIHCHLKRLVECSTDWYLLNSVYHGISTIPNIFSLSFSRYKSQHYHPQHVVSTSLLVIEPAIFNRTTDQYKSSSSDIVAVYRRNRNLICSPLIWVYPLLSPRCPNQMHQNRGLLPISHWPAIFTVLPSTIAPDESDFKPDRTGPEVWSLCSSFKVWSSISSTYWLDHITTSQHPPLSHCWSWLARPTLPSHRRWPTLPPVATVRRCAAASGSRANKPLPVTTGHFIRCLKVWPAPPRWSICPAIRSTTFRPMSFSTEVSSICSASSSPTVNWVGCTLCFLIIAALSTCIVSSERDSINRFRIESWTAFQVRMCDNFVS